MKSEGCFACQIDQSAGKCIVVRSQLKEIKAGERVTIHTSLSGIGPIRVTGRLLKQYNTGDSHVELGHRDGFSLIPSEYI